MTENEDFISFEKALRELKMQSEELKKLVSEGDIRAFRDGTSMKFRAEDVAAIADRAFGEDDLILADALEDDTGMVTEELSDEDTLLVEDDLDDEIEELPAATSTRASSRRERIQAPAKTAEPGWVTAALILGFVAMLWTALLCVDISSGAIAGDTFYSGIWGPEK